MISSKGRYALRVMMVLADRADQCFVPLREIAEDEDILLITDDGTIIRTAADSIRICGRATQGVRLMRVGDGSRIVGVARAEKEGEDDETDAPENAAEESDAGEDVSAEPNEEI